ncbi:ScbR family autoregulator-binding transcription factor [Kitasatospora sp. NPDC101801]|uniref:ScbR family autoregulator-binding transcription factor n=1 Tax=Kitasatospora sp. NPDC101801 TaxID=3364103 RepID=UPI0037FA0634
MSTPAFQWPALARGPEPRQDRSARTRDLVLLKAAELFAEKGYRTASIKEVAERTGMTKGAVYHHFPTKDALVIAVVEAQYDRWPEMVQQVRTETTTALEAAFKVTDRVAEAFITDPVTRAVARLQAERSSVPFDLPAPYVGWISLMTQLLTEAEQAGELRAGVSPEQIAHAMVASFYGTQHISDLLHDRADLAQRWQEQRSLLWYAISSEPDRPAS